MSTELRQDGAVLTITLTGNTAARLFGLPFLAVGGYLGYQLAGGVVNLLSGRAAVVEFLPGTVLLLVVTLAFLIPGWLLVFSRARVDIDRATDAVTYVRDLRVYQRRERRALSEFARIEVDRLTVAPNRPPSRKAAWQVELASPDRRNVVIIGLFDTHDEACAFGRRVGIVIGLPVEDLREVERAEG